MRLVGLELGVMLILLCEFIFVIFVGTVGIVPVIYIHDELLYYIYICVSRTYLAPFLSMLHLLYNNLILSVTIFTIYTCHTTPYNQSSIQIYFQKTRPIRWQRRRSSNIQTNYPLWSDAQAYIRLHHRTYCTTILHRHQVP